MPYSETAEPREVPGADTETVRAPAAQVHPGKEDIWKDRGAASEEKRDRIRKLKDLRDNGIMTREEYNRMVDKIMRS